MNANYSKLSLKLAVFGKNKYKFNIVLNTRNIRWLFQIRDNVKHYNCIIYKDNFHVTKIMLVNPGNIVLRWAKHEDPNKQSEPTQNLKYFPDQFK